MADNELKNKKRFIERLRWMSHEEFQEIKKTDQYRAINSDPEMKDELRAMFTERMSSDRKRVKLLETLYTSPGDTMEWIKNIQAYRDLRCLQVILCDDLSDNDNKLWFSSLDKGRRDCHNKALASFCRLVMKSSPDSNRSNTPVIPGSSFGIRDEGNGDLYAGPLMIPYEEENNYGTHDVRDAMTTGMFQFLILMEETARSDWDRAKERALEMLAIKGKTVDREKLPDVKLIQRDLISSRRSHGAKSASPAKDDFDPFDVI